MKKQALLDYVAHQYSENEVLEIELAIDFATNAHRGQKRKSGEAYITHPLSVTYKLAEWGMDADTVIAGILHDTVEDTDATLEQI